MSRFENVHNVHALMSLHYYILTFNLIVLGLTLQALRPKFISHLLESIFSCIILSIVSLWNMGVLVHYNKGKSSLTGWGGVSKTQTSKLQTPWKMTEIVNAVLHEWIFIYDTSNEKLWHQISTPLFILHYGHTTLQSLNP